MNIKHKTTEEYLGFEQGPIRPPSEAYSLLVRVTRNCPWNHCTFCPVYKDTRFSIRPKDHVIKDIDSIYRSVEIIQKTADGGGKVPLDEIRRTAENNDNLDPRAFNAALNWVSGGMRSVFIQDANSLIIKSSDLVEILTHLKTCFPWVERITSYARSHTIARISDDNLKAIRDAGLNRIHIGLESGSDKVLKMIKKGVTKESQIKAGLKVKKAGMELSEYVMPGLGGKAFSKEHAVETADALNQINPDFIRLRTLAIPNIVALYDDYEAGRFEKCTDLMMAEEVLLFIESLNGITSVLKSDHILNLFQNLEGKFPEDKENMLDIVRRFLAMTPDRQCIYQVGRRLGYFSRLSDMDNPRRLERAQKSCRQFGITPENVDEVIDELMRRFI
ncbi:MAG: radical SAM protein [Desulfobacteraceae bacterium]|nr:radical SAM protein [Desulfobacteraceae bacterium]MDH3838388.1 radical SAM protein [Desulfobacteraceae bacterium]MDH3875739.1 radical SAM protein [Desulfobacteraceae bacterium]